ncbi:hypothetical protein VNO78_05244 [Psophocarpus tetragonolobus]|uniref:Uncharacterized protein n=1 Tax=Psophocarpus tetragonolobus TaxID=3891 RepID=A0AAN9SQL4_PSOTE
MLLLPLLCCFNGIYEHFIFTTIANWFHVNVLRLFKSWNSDGNIISLSNMNSLIYAELISDARIKICF